MDLIQLRWFRRIPGRLHLLSHGNRVLVLALGCADRLAYGAASRRADQAKFVMVDPHWWPRITIGLSPIQLNANQLYDAIVC